MIGLRRIRRKIRSVRNIQKITRAMEMVSAAKLRRIHDRLVALRPYANKMTQMLRDLAPYLAHIEHPLLAVRQPRVPLEAPARPASERVPGGSAQAGSVGIMVISADKGLCGSYNGNIIRNARGLIENVRTARGSEVPIGLFAIGRKSRDFFKKTGYTLEMSITPIPPEFTYARVKDLTADIAGRYERAELDEFHIVYTEYVNPLTQRPRVFKFLPIQSEAPTETKPRFPYGYLFEPQPQEILKKLLPRYVETVMFRIVLEALASEHGARMSAMRNATDNADEMLKELTLTFNKARQASITKELLDIVGGAEAMR